MLLRTVGKVVDRGSNRYFMGSIFYDWVKASTMAMARANAKRALRTLRRAAGCSGTKSRSLLPACLTGWSGERRILGLAIVATPRSDVLSPHASRHLK